MKELKMSTSKVKKPEEFKVLLVYPNLSMMLTPSYAIGLWTSILKNKNYKVDLFDCTSYMPDYEFVGKAEEENKTSLEESGTATRANKLMASRKFDPIKLFGAPKKDLIGDFKKKIESFKPDAVIISTLVEDTWPQAQDIMSALKNYPNVKSIVGGVFPTMAPRQVIADPNIECIAEGEGEHIIPEFCEAVRLKLDITSIKGTRVRLKDGSIKKNAPRELTDINDVIPDFSLFDEKRFLRPLGAKIWKAMPIETYRGCPYKCAFCNSPTQVLLAKERNQGRYTRRKSMNTLRKELKSMVDNYNPNFLYINDDAFMARPRKEIKEFAEMYKEFKMPFWCQTRFEDIDEEKIKWLQEVGLYRMSFGLEHGNQEFRKKRLFRNITNKMILEKAETLGRLNVSYSMNIIIGMPYETRDLIFDTINLAREIKTFDSLAVNIFAPYRGTVLRGNAIKEGWLDPNAKASSFIGKSILKMPKPYLQPEEMLGLQRVFPLYVTMDKTYYNDIKKAEYFTQEGNEIFEKLSEKYYIDKYGTSSADRMLTYAG
jgi:anaerobic magnesium-protoporphyrin IX monomethyl ester cyclase